MKQNLTSLMKVPEQTVENFESTLFLWLQGDKVTFLLAPR